MKIIKTILLILLVVSCTSLLIAQTETVNYGTESGTQGNYNSFFGYRSGRISAAHHNTFIGHRSGYNNTTGYDNVFLGSSTGASNTTGAGNVFIGHYSGTSNTTGAKNMFSGFYAGRRNTTGGHNTFMGNYAGYNNTTGGANVFLGNHSGGSNTTGAGNVFLGNHSGNKSTTADSNVFVGNYTGYQHATGSRNVFIGDRAGYNNLLGQNNILIGYKAGFNETGSAKLYIDNSDTATPLLYGDFNSNQLGINTNVIPSGYAFAVKGKMIAEKLKVQVYPWADYVFKEDYKLPSLEEVEDHIKTKGHLEHIPSANEVAKEGIYVGEMHSKLLRKIEELTLYTIAQEKQLKQQAAANAALKARLDKIESLLQDQN